MSIILSHRYLKFQSINVFTGQTFRLCTIYALVVEKSKVITWQNFIWLIIDIFTHMNYILVCGSISIIQIYRSLGYHMETLTLFGPFLDHKRDFKNRMCSFPLLLRSQFTISRTVATEEEKKVAFVQLSSWRRLHTRSVVSSRKLKA